MLKLGRHDGSNGGGEDEECGLEAASEEMLLLPGQGKGEAEEEEKEVVVMGSVGEKRLSRYAAWESRSVEVEAPTSLGRARGMSMVNVPVGFGGGGS